MATFILREKNENGIVSHIYAETETDLGVLANYLFKSGIISKPVALHIAANGNDKWGFDCVVGEEADCLTLFREARKIDGGLLAHEVRFVCHPELMEEIAIGIAKGVDGFGKVASYSFRFTLATEDDCGAFVSFAAWNENGETVTTSQIGAIQRFVNIVRKSKGLPLVHILALDEEGAEIVEFED